MPRQPVVPEIRLENLNACLTPVIAVLNELNDSFAPPFILSISDTIGSLINLAQSVKQNRKECAQLMENIHYVVHVIINLHLKSEVAGSLPPAMVYHVGKFMETLHKIYIYFQAQQDRNKFKQLFRNNEMNNLLKDCHVGLNQALEAFEINTNVMMLYDIGQFKKVSETMHNKLLELISTMSETDVTSNKSSACKQLLLHIDLDNLEQVYLDTNDSKNSSNSFSLLPSKPKIFYGRETEVEEILRILGYQAPRIAILGGGGMGKTSLARTVLHHPDTLIRFEERFFVSAESAATSIELAALIGLHVGLNPGQDLTKLVIQYFAKRPSCLLILDNLETVWEPIQSRKGIEEFLSLLTAFEHVGLIITMRGAERPAKVQWTHPFLLPLQPLSDDAAQQTFMDITDNFYAIEDLNQLLSFTDNMPLAVDLIAHLVDYEGLENVLARWETEKTSMLSVGYDRRSNLDASISLSLSSPRITSDSKQLLSLLSILPNGLSDAELVQSNLPISNILKCKAALLATSLVYQTSNKRLLVLVPIREHIQQFLPPSVFLIDSLRKYFHTLLNLYKKYQIRAQPEPVIGQIASNLANLQEVLQRGLHDNDSNLADTIDYTISLSSFYRITGRGATPLMNHIWHSLPKPLDHQLEIHLFIEFLTSYGYYANTSFIEECITQGISYFKQINDPLLESKFYLAASAFARYISDSPRTQQFIQKAQELAILSGDSNQQSIVLKHIAFLKIAAGDFLTAQVYAREAHQLSELSMNLYESAATLRVQAICSRSLGNYQESMLQIHKAREIIEICSMSGGLVDQLLLVDKGGIYILKSEYTHAKDIFSRLATTFLDRNAGSYGNTLLNIACIDIKIGSSPETVHKNLDKVTKVLNSPLTVIQVEMIEASLDLREHKFDLAQEKFLECLRFPDNEVGSFCLERLADITAWPAIELQLNWPVIYLGHAKKSKEKLALHKALLFLGDVFIIHKDEDTASNLFTVALEGFTFMDVHESRAQCMLRLGDLANKHGNIPVAIDWWKTARPLFERSSQAKDVSRIDSRLAALERTQEEALAKLATLQTPDTVVERAFISGKEPVEAVLI